ncbi:MAG: hypothetical protein MUC92_08185 [Fimbriimonadaceae bacterium]|nr:hypothetical protein [Fimbriimonadaceae bacterium]
MLLADVRAMSNETLSATAGGATRSGFDFLYEVAVVNKRMAARFKGQDPGPSSEGWIMAPEEFRDQEKIASLLEESYEEIAEAVESFDSNRFDEQPIPESTWTYLDLAGLAAIHGVYHDAQLNYIQAMHGDEAVHWM